jgi:hypothetical protein
VGVAAPLPAIDRNDATMAGNHPLTGAGEELPLRIAGVDYGGYHFNPQGNRLSGLAVGKSFNGLEDTDQGQPSGREGRLSGGSEGCGKLGIGEEWTEGIDDRRAD